MQIAYRMTKFDNTVGGVAMGILTSDPFLITWSTSLGIVSFFLKFIATGANLYICDVGIAIGIWGVVSAVITRWKEMRPHHNIRKYELMANVVVLVGIPSIFVLWYVMIGILVLD